MNKKKGFTLIELLAVIVILAIIALIATPLIMNIINDAKKGAFEDSSYAIINAAEQGYAKGLIKELDTSITEYEYSEGVRTLKQGNVEVNYKGSSPKSGTLLINKEGEVAIAFYSNGWCITKGYAETKITTSAKSKTECIITEEVPNTEDTIYNSEKGVNDPQLVRGMTPIKWVDGVETETTINDEDWYDYRDQKWANAKTEDGSYFVWIPRYAYKIGDGWHTSTANSISIIFLENDTINNNNDITIYTSGYDADGTMNTKNYYFLHPAFQNETIYGFWVAKFEASNTTSFPKSIPNVTPLTNIIIDNMFTAAENMSNNTSYGWNSETVDTHMMSNYEWGAIVYLSFSIYGKNSEVSVNNTIYTGGDRYTPYTSNVSQSTTGNETGLYDMNGSAYEYVSAYIDNSNSNLGTYGNSIINSTSKYIKVYSIGNSDTDSENYEASKNIYGDAIYETSSSVGVNRAWNIGYAQMPNSTAPWFVRGGDRRDTTYDGLFSFNRKEGKGISGSDSNNYRYYTFRFIAVEK